MECLCIITKIKKQFILTAIDMKTKQFLILPVALLLQISLQYSLAIQLSDMGFLGAFLIGYLLFGLALKSVFAQAYDWKCDLYALLPLTVITVAGVFANPLLFPSYFPLGYLQGLAGFWIGKTLWKSTRAYTGSALLGMVLWMLVLWYWVSPYLHYQQRIVESPLLGRALEYELYKPNGQRVSSQSLKGKVVVLDFWFKSCKQCRVKNPYFEQLAKQYKGRPDVAVLSVAMGSVDSLSVAQAFMRQQQYSFDWLYDKGGLAVKKMAFTGAPHEVIFDKQGKIRSIQHGFTYDLGLQYLKYKTEEIDALLAE